MIVMTTLPPYFSSSKVDFVMAEFFFAFIISQAVWYVLLDPLHRITHFLFLSGILEVEQYLDLINYIWKKAGLHI